jgi:leader peptidase (prepilin peptidase)/N-methyltransferase
MKFFLLANIAFFSLLIGSFFTVVIYRLPLILYQQWKQDSLQFLNQEKEISLNKSFNIFLPFSHCPDCHKYLTILQKIPLLSYFFLRGKCAYCERKISVCYPLIR